MTTSFKVGEIIFDELFKLRNCDHQHMNSIQIFTRIYITESRTGGDNFERRSTLAQHLLMSLNREPICLTDSESGQTPTARGPSPRGILAYCHLSERQLSRGSIQPVVLPLEGGDNASTD